MTKRKTAAKTNISNATCDNNDETEGRVVVGEEKTETTIDMNDAAPEDSFENGSAAKRAKTESDCEKNSPENESGIVIIKGGDMHTIIQQSVLINLSHYFAAMFDKNWTSQDPNTTLCCKYKIPTITINDFDQRAVKFLFEAAAEAEEWFCWSYVDFHILVDIIRMLDYYSIEFNKQTYLNHLKEWKIGKNDALDVIEGIEKLEKIDSLKDICEHVERNAALVLAKKLKTNQDVQQLILQNQHRMQAVLRLLNKIEF